MLSSNSFSWGLRPDADANPISLEQNITNSSNIRAGMNYYQEALQSPSSNAFHIPKTGTEETTVNVDRRKH